MNIKIKDIPINERPRERLINKGASNISNEELLSIILKSGTKNESAKVVATKILSTIKDISELKNLTYESLIKINGIGSTKACDLLATIELAKRINVDIDNINNLKITSSDIVYTYYKNIIGDKFQEHFYVIYLDNKKKVINNKLLFIGTINYSVVHPREIFKEAYSNSASSIICVHNHPSGNSKPSDEDISLTNRLVEISNLMGIKLIDHVIITKKNYYSFYENNLIK